MKWSLLALLAVAHGANPIRRVVTLLQNMQAKVQEERRADEELMEKFLCYCKSNDATLGKSIEDGSARIERLESEIKELSGSLSQVESELKTHHADRSAAETVIREAEGIRATENDQYVADSGELQANIDALGKAVAALEKGTAESFLQMPARASLLNVLESRSQSTNLDRMDVQVLTGFLQGKTEFGSGPESGEIIGILKTMREQMQKDLAEMNQQESDAQSRHDSLMAAKNKELAAATRAIEEKTKRAGETSVGLVNRQNELKDTNGQLEEDTTFLRTLKEDCKVKTTEFDARQKLRTEEIKAISETIKILNDDDALDLFKKTAPAAGAGAEGESFLQVGNPRETSAIHHARSILKKASSRDVRFGFLVLAMRGQKGGMEKVVDMIDKMQLLLKQEQSKDDKQKRRCEKELAQNEQSEKDLKRTLRALNSQISEGKDTMNTLKGEIDTLEAGIKDLDASVATATKQRKDEHDQYMKESADNNAAVELLGFAKNRLAKFYAPSLHKEAPPPELSEEDRIYQASGGELEPTPAPGGIANTGISGASFMQVSMRMRSRDAPPAAPETGAYEKNSASTGVLGLIDKLVNEIKAEGAEAKRDEQDAQKEYERIMDESSKKRAADATAISQKNAALAEAEAEVQETKDDRKSTTEDLTATQEVVASLHGECDWLLANFAERKKARAGEVDALSNAKAVLRGSDYSFIQSSSTLRHLRRV